MRRDSATTVIDRNMPFRKRREFRIVPYCVIIIVIALLGVVVAVRGTVDRVEAGVSKSKYTPILSEPMPPKPMALVPEQPVSVKYRHVIFRLGKWEICRLTYEESEQGDSRERGHE
ncbi:MAG: hypothetical protein LBS30_02055 [Planctomycetota bacterium]|jgi:hypothetical protein|nr:hypothetical protein [Planctomycetota bacterium]